MRLFKKGQGATEYLLMLAAVLVIVAIAVYYVTSTGPSAVITGSATLKSGDNTVVEFTPSTSMTPTTIAAADYEWAVYDGATLKGSGSGASDLERGIPLEFDAGTTELSSGFKVKIKYGDTWYDAATIA